MIEDFELESLQKLVVFADSLQGAEDIQKKLMQVTKRAKREGQFLDLEISRKEGNTNIIISSLSGLSGIHHLLYQSKPKLINAEDFKLVSQQIRDLQKIKTANDVAEKLLGSNNMYTPAKRQLTGKSTIKFNLGGKNAPVTSLSPELEALLAEQRELQKKSLFIKK